MKRSQLGVADFIIFGISLSLSISVGVFYMLKDKCVRLRQGKRGQRDPASPASGERDKFLVGGRKLPMIPVMLSVVTTFLSGVTLLGTPAEIYQRGLSIWVWYLTAPLALAASGYIFIPIFYSFRPISIYEYFELRFDSVVIRKVAAAVFIFVSLFYMAVVIYAPAVALSGVTNMDTWYLIIIVAIVCTFYTTIGGLKAVVWTDSLQAVFMYGGLATVIAMGIHASGGVHEVMRISVELGRFEPLTYVGADPAQYCSLWGAIFGGFTYWMALYGLNQMAMQRYVNLPTLHDSYKVIILTIPFFLVLGTMACFIGMVMLAYFQKCDPLTAGEISSKDQLVILMVVDTLGKVPGLAGIFVSCLFSGTLSTVSSGLNSMTAVIWEDFLKNPLGHLSDSRTTMVTKLISVILGIAAMGLAFSASSLGGLISACLTVMGSLGGPLVGLFTLGVFVPQANKYGAMCGGIIGVAFCVWIALGSVTHAVYAKYTLPFSNTGCNQSTYVMQNVQSVGNITIAGTESMVPDLSSYVPYPYRISPYLFGFFALILTVVIGTVVSYAVPKKWRPIMKNGDMRLTFWQLKNRPVNV